MTCENAERVNDCRRAVRCTDTCTYSKTSTADKVASFRSRYRRTFSSCGRCCGQAARTVRTDDTIKREAQWWWPQPANQPTLAAKERTCHCWRRSNQPTNQRASQPASQPTNQPTSQPAIQPSTTDVERRCRGERTLL